MPAVQGARAREKLAAGKALRAAVPRSSHAGWSAAPGRPDPVATVVASNADRLARLVPIRMERMAESAFGFYRGAAAIMAADLAHTPVSGLHVQLSGDAHCMNFGGFATPERNLLFDINDFDETMPGPWEWDLKRLVTSIVIAARHNEFSARNAKVAALAATQAYRQRMQEFAAASALEVWYARLDATKILDAARSAGARRRRGRIAEQAATDSVRAAVAKFTNVAGGVRRFIDDPPLLYHSTATDDDDFDVAEIVGTYAWNLPPDVQVLLERYTLADAAIKVVGVGSVGTRCAVAVFAADEDDAFILQIKEALPSVLAAHLGPSEFENHGERVVRGQRVMQAASDVFLGWALSGTRCFYVRQFRDMKTSADLEAMDAYQLREYAHYCAWALAGAHARSGDAAAIAGYGGKSAVLDRALLEFALDYADQNERDYERFVASVKTAAPPASAVPA
ncbi:MAG: DUF2252 domain-containing protein [Candidatus Eremiobacteraeota bacterium]|nr:DUF2252 domain-containing protein [Candidatus Eremiobacteraeota bacterium]